MDNPNDPNSPNNPNQTPSPFGTPPQPISPTPTPPPPPVQPQEPTWPSTPFPTQSGPLQPEPTPSPFPEPAPFPAQPQPDPIQPEPIPSPFPTPSVPLPAEPQPIPSQTPGSNLSSLDNPWGAPVQPPPFDGSLQNTSTQPEPVQPTWSLPPSAPIEAEPTTSSSMPEQAISDIPLTSPEPASQGEPAPTDLSHLISNNNQQENPPPSFTPETLVVPSTSTVSPEISVPTENHQGIPKWVIGVGIGLILIVAVTSAYFILGVGQPSKTTTSLPATTASKTQNQVKPPAPIVTSEPEPTTPPSATNSANFGQLQGNPPAATSAADLIRQRQGR